MTPGDSTPHAVSAPWPSGFKAGMMFEVVMHPDGTREFTYLSESVRQLYGISPQQGMADSSLIYGRVHEEDIQSLLRTEDEAARTFSTFNAEVRVKDPSGALRWSSLVSSPRKMDDGSTCWDGIELVITERKRAELELKEAHELLTQFIRHSPIFSYIKEVTATESRVLHASDSFERIIGIKGSDMVGRTMTELFPAEFADKITADDWHVVSTGEMLTIDEELNGRSYATLKAPIVVGSRTFLVGSSIDITERKRAEEEHTAHIRFLESLEQVDHAIRQQSDVEEMLWAIVRTVFSIFDCDRAWLLYPCDPEAPSFRVPVEVAKPEYPGAKILNVDVPMSQGEADNMREALGASEPVIFTAGTDRPVMTAKVFGVQSQMFIPIFPKIGKPWVFGMHQCSHPRVWTDGERRLFNEIGRRMADGLSSVLIFRELRENEERFRATFEQAAVGIAHVAPDGRWLLMNQKLCDIVGYSKEELLHKTFQDITHPDDLHTDVEAARQLLAGEISTCSWEKRYIRKDGSIAWVALTESMVHHGSAEPPYFISVSEDITQRKKAEQDKASLESQLRQAQKMESLGRLAGGVAHDFNNMLLVISGHAEMAMEQVHPGEPMHADLEEIRKAAERSANLTRQLLAFARQQTIAPRVLDLNTAVEGMLKMLRRLIGEDIDLAWLPGADLWPVKMDTVQIDQILANLCVNARDAIVGVGRVTIATAHISCDAAFCAAHPGFAPGDYVQLAVSDNGCGMDADTLRRLFEPFFTTKGLDKGTGLGLATVYGIVRQNNGFIDVISDVGRGTTFRIYLPRHAANGEPVETNRPAQSELHGHEVILLVEDEPSILRLSATMLRSLGYTVIPANTPGEAISLAREHSQGISLLMTDVVMPEMNGRDLAEHVRSFHPNVIRLFMSGYTADVIAEHGVLDAGVNFIQKPFSKSDLAVKVREALDGR